MKFQPTKEGYYGQFGGAFIPELLYPNVKELEDNYLEILSSEAFQKEYKDLLQHYVGRPSPLYLAKRLSEKYGVTIYLKREDLNHTGAHKVNNTIGQILVAKHLGSPIIGDTKYNKLSNYNFEKLKLNAFLLKFKMKQKEYKFISYLPEHFKTFMSKNNLKIIDKKIIDNLF